MFSAVSKPSMQDDTSRRPKTPTRLDMRHSKDPNPVTRRAFLIDVVVPDHADLSAAPYRDLVAALGSPVEDRSEDSRLSHIPAAQIRSALDVPADYRGQPAGDRAKLEALVKEFVDTERRYLQRISALKTSYADPLRRFARQPATLIIPLYDARSIFSNLDAVVEASSAFLVDIAQIDLSGRVKGNGIGDVCLRHLKDLGTLSCYKAYLDKQDESQRALQAMLKRPAFATFVESVKYQTTGISNVGIRELLMEPVQRIPRYTLLWQSMIKVMSPRDPQCAKLQQAIAMASNIAHCQTDERTRRATIMFCLERTIEGFPANLISNKRDFIDIIDVEDFPPERLLHRGSIANLSPSKRPTETPLYGSPERGASTSNSLSCTLVLLSDKLLILKRQHSNVSGPETTGLHDINALMASGGGLAGLSKVISLRKDKLSFKGCVDITDTIAADLVDSGDMHLFLERPPADQGERWSGRPFRHLAVPSLAMRDAKSRFLRNLWRAQAVTRLRAASLPTSRGADALPVALVEVNHATLDPDNDRNSAVTFWNVWPESAWRNEAVKAKMVAAIGLDSGLSLGQGDDPPHVVINLGALADGLLRVISTSKDADRGDQGGLDLDAMHIAQHLSELAHRLGLFRFRPSSSMAPLTPTHSYRMRPKMVNLDSISRNLFGASSMSTRSDSVSTSRRSKSVTSRYSTTDEFCFSTDTASTRASSLFGDSLGGCGELSKMQVLQSVAEVVSLHESTQEADLLQAGHAEASEIDLDLQLSIARANSIDAATAMNREKEGLGVAGFDRESDRRRGVLRVMNGTPSPEAPPQLSGVDRYRDDDFSTGTTEPLRIVRSRSASPEKVLNRTPTWTTRQLGENDKQHKVDENSLQAAASRSENQTNGDLASKQIGSGHTKLRVVSGRGRRVSANRETAPLRLDTRPADAVAAAAHKRARSEEADFPRKRSYDSQSMPAGIADMSRRSPSAADGTSTPASIHLGVGVLDGPLRPHAESAGAVAPGSNGRNREDDQLDQAALATIRLKAAFDTLSTYSAQSLARQQHRRRIEGSEGASLPRSPPSRRLSRLDHTSGFEGSGPVTPHRSRDSKPDIDGVFLQEWSQSALTVLSGLEGNITRAQHERDEAVQRVMTMTASEERMSNELLGKQNRLDRAAARHAMAQSQIAELQKEVDAVYEAFNTELDGVFADVGRPASEAELALRRNLQITKAERNAAQLENLRLRRELQEANLKKAEWAQILKSRGIIP